MHDDVVDRQLDLRTRSGAADLSPTALAEALGKLLVFASVYPADHVRVTSLAVPLAAAIARRATDDAPCVLSLAEEGLLLDEQPIAAVTVATRHLQRDLETLSVCEVDFFRTITAADLIEFANAVRTTTRRESGRRTFEEPRLLALPPSIATRFSDFGTPVFGTEAEGQTWVGETFDLGEPEAGAQSVALEDWRRLSRILVTGLLGGPTGEADLGALEGALDEGTELAPREGGAASSSAEPSAAAGEGSGGGRGAGDGRGDGDGAAERGKRSEGDGGSGGEGGQAPVLRAVIAPAGRTAKDASETDASDAGGGSRGAASVGAAAAGTGAGGTGAGGSGAGGSGAGGSGAGGTGAAGRGAGGGAAVLGQPGGAGGSRSDRPGSGAVRSRGAVTGRAGGPTRTARGEARGAQSRPGIAPKDGYRARGTRQRIRAVEEAVRRAVERALKANGNVRSVTRIVEEARQLLPQLAPELPLEHVLAGIREALDEHLRDSFRTEGGASFDKARRPAREGAECKLTVPELLAEAGAVAASATANTLPDRTTEASEQLSILLHMLEEERRPGVMDGITRRLFARLSRQLERDEIAVMGGWIESLCGAGRPAALADRLLPMLLDQLRRAAPSCTLAVLMSALDTPRQALLRTLWPHLGIEILCGLDGSGEAAREQAVGLLAEVDEAVLGSEADRFAALLALGRTSHSVRFLDPPRKRLSGFYLMILGLREHAALASMIVAGYRRAPPPNSAARALVAIHAEVNARSFLRRVLQEEIGGGETESLRKMAAGIVAAAVRGLRREERRAPWVAEAVRGLGTLRCTLAEQVVEGVLRERRFLILPSWPRACRRAAADARLLLRKSHQETAERPAEEATP